MGDGHFHPTFPVVKKGETMVKLLIAEDEALEREAIKFIIDNHFPDCFEIREAGNGRETIAFARQFFPDLLFLDIKMPGCNGIEAAQEIRKFIPECRIIILSAYHHFNYAQSAITFGADEYLTKPAPPAKIVATLNRVLKVIDDTRLKKIHEAETVRRLEQISKYLQDEFLIRVALSEMEVETAKTYFDILQLDFQALLFAILRISGPTATPKLEIDRTILQSDLLGYLQGQINGLGHYALIRPIGTDFFMLLLIRQELTEYQSRIFGINLFNGIKKAVFQKFGLTMNIGISNITSNIADICTACQQARQSLTYDETPGTTTSFGDISKDRKQSTYPLYKEDQLLNYVVRTNPEKSLELLDDLLDWLETVYPGELVVFQEKVYELLLVLARKVIFNICWDGLTIDANSLRHAIFKLQSVPKLRAYAENFVVAKIYEIGRLKKSRASALIALVGNYLEENYAREISLDDAAAFVKISSFYLSKLFKKELGENFIDYLTGIRIRKAKEILSNPRNTVKDVCYRVGYRDPNYFSRVFKKISGMTPTEYQSKYMR
jgi:two-component system response regulator YesN